MLGYMEPPHSIVGYIEHLRKCHFYIISSETLEARGPDELRDTLSPSTRKILCLALMLTRYQKVAL